MAEAAGPTLVEAARHAWRTVLGDEPLDDEDNFFEAGGDSLSALELVTILDERVGARLAMAELYRAPTFGGLVGALGAVAADDVPTAHHTTGRTLVRLRRGGADRLWCFLPPLSGAVTRYAAMPHLLPTGDAVWAMETPAELSSGGMALLVAGLADRLLAEGLDGFDTVVFSGYSLGGVFAHELARHVAGRLADGGPRLIAALLDPPDPSEYRPSATEAFDIFVRVGWRIPEPADSFVTGDGTFALDRVAAAARAAGTLPSSAPDDEIVDAWTVYASNARILEDYPVRAGVAETYLLQCDAGTSVPSGHWKSGVPAKGAWAGAVDASRVDVLAVEHFAMLEPPNDATVGRWLSAVADGTRGRG